MKGRQRLLWLVGIIFCVAFAEPAAAGGFAKKDKEGALSGQLNMAIGMNDVDDVRDLIAAGVDIDAPIPPTGLAPLMVADSAEMTGLLIDLGADVNVSDSEGATPLHHAVMASEPAAMVALLLRHGADPNVAAKGWSGETPLLVARLLFIERGDAEAGETILRMLVGRGADIDARDDHGDTLLMTAVVNRRPELAYVSLQLGADPTVRNMDGHTPLDMAEDLGYGDIAALLRATGADQ